MFSFLSLLLRALISIHCLDVANLSHLDTSARKRPQKSDYGITWNSYSAYVGGSTAVDIHVGERNTRAPNLTSQM